ncbi:thymidine phosphorylase [Ferruginivarius sediminum]|uniref:Thymidine phosphorylase n=1 Tax=Ferruginivarius sediminum TaxID=2661937 RepID=A0A369T7A6_9PROT|nr:thymidine phosphorylase [Ferruginivarius sediminum]RDD60752.1 thymidine phosphorylase [Ferruginivarius sediminum]
MTDTPFPQEIIRRKRDGEAVNETEIGTIVAGLADGSLSEAQAAAFAMAVCLNGMDQRETAALTRAMADSGETLDWPDVDRPVVDKHSTGGVGDTVSLILAPIVAACGGAVPMISGRGLGHTGGTLDKLDAIPGYNAMPDLKTFRKVVREVGCAIVGATSELAPADRRLYAIRDVTATVESIPLIVASILSKKLAAGLGGLVMDVKFGSGAFMRELPDARTLAEALVATGKAAGLPTVALLSDMDQPLARSAGNAVEVREAIAQLTARTGNARLRVLTLRLAAEMLQLAGLADNREDARRQADRALADGRAAERFQAMVGALGGPADLIERPDKHLPRAPVQREAPAPHPGYVAKMDARALGVAIMHLGGARHRAEDTVDPAVGLSGLAQVGDRVEAGTPLAIVHARDEQAADAAKARVLDAYTISESPAHPLPLVAARVPSGGEL